MIQTESIASSTASATAAADAADQSGTTATSAADTATSSAAKFQLPGTQLSVLPIGLGVFAGISVIALIVVGLVTYERTKYRRVSLLLLVYLEDRTDNGDRRSGNASSQNQGPPWGMVVWRK